VPSSRARIACIGITPTWPGPLLYVDEKIFGKMMKFEEIYEI
jgi:hypothetical protein